MFDLIPNIYAHLISTPNVNTGQCCIMASKWDGLANGHSNKHKVALIFCWELAWNYEGNSKGVQTISDYIKKNGASWVFEAAANTCDISQNDLKLCVTQKFKDIISTLKNVRSFDSHRSIIQRVEMGTKWWWRCSWWEYCNWRCCGSHKVKEGSE